MKTTTLISTAMATMMAFGALTSTAQAADEKALPARSATASPRPARTTAPPTATPAPARPRRTPTARNGSRCRRAPATASSAAAPRRSRPWRRTLKPPGVDSGASRDRPAGPAPRRPPRRAAGGRLARGAQRELFRRRRRAARLPGATARDLSAEPARRRPVARFHRPARPRAPAAPEAPGGPLRARPRLRAPVLGLGRRRAPERPPAAALHRGSPAPHRPPRGRRAGRARPADPDRERLELPAVHRLGDDRVGVPRGARARVGLRPAARRQQCLRQRAQPRLRSAGVPGRRAARRPCRRSISPATPSTATASARS